LRTSAGAPSGRRRNQRRSALDRSGEGEGEAHLFERRLEGSDPFGEGDLEALVEHARRVARILDGRDAGGGLDEPPVDGAASETARPLEERLALVARELAAWRLRDEGH